MTILIYDAPVTDPSRMRQAAKLGAVAMLGGSLIGMIILAVVLADTQVDAMLAYAVGAVFYWLISLLIVLPALALIWPIIKFALRRGLSGLMPALAVGGATGGLIGLLIWSSLAANTDLRGVAIFAGVSLIYSLLCWIGMQRAIRG